MPDATPVSRLLLVPAPAASPRDPLAAPVRRLRLARVLLESHDLLDLPTSGRCARRPAGRGGPA